MFTPPVFTFFLLTRVSRGWRGGIRWCYRSETLYHSLYDSELYFAGQELIEQRQIRTSDEELQNYWFYYPAVELLFEFIL